MPNRSTVILTLMEKTDPLLKGNCPRGLYLIDDFYEHNRITSDEAYTNILRTGITRPRVFLERMHSEKWF